MCGIRLQWVAVCVTVTVSEPAEAGNTMTETELDEVPLAWLVAVTVTAGGAGTLAGAVYSPVGVMVPNVAFPPTMLFTLQFTAILLVPVTLAVNCCVSPV